MLNPIIALFVLIHPANAGLHAGDSSKFPAPLNLGTTFGQQPSTKDVLDKKDTRVEPTSWGSVYGRVYDAETGAPLTGVTVNIEGDTGFETKGKSVAITDDLGGFKAQAVLGRISHNFDVGRALLSSGIGLLFGSATNTTKRIDVAQVNVRATAFGYRPFEGVVVARSQDADKFRIDLEPILLVKDGRPGVSVSATAWSAVRITNFVADPPMARKGDTVQLKASVIAFGKSPMKTVEVVAFSRLWRGERKLKMSDKQATEGPLLFTAEYKVSGKEKSKVEPVYVAIKKSLLDFDPQRSARAAIVQIISVPADAEAAALRQSSIEKIRAGQPQDAFAGFKKLTLADPNVFDLRMLARTAEDTSDWGTAADAWLQLSSIKGDESEELAQFARTLYKAKRYDAIISAVAPALTKEQPKNWPKKVPASAVGHLGLAYVKVGKVAEASNLNEELLNWPASGLETSVIEFRGTLRLAEVELEHAKAPNSAQALSDYGRALLDLGRFEEAVGKLQASLEKDPNQQAVKRDLTWAALQIQGAKPANLDLQTAVTEAQAALNLDKGKQRSKDFFSWDQYAVLLYALSEQQAAMNLPQASDTQSEAISALREALSLGRVGAKRSAGAFSYSMGYTSGSQVAISGFAYPQANASFVLLDSLEKLRRNPADALALFNRTTALLDLGQLALAKSSLDRFMQQRPQDLEGQFVGALLAAKTGDTENAKALLSKVAAGNPLHPRANLLLADLYARDGDVAMAAERLAEHAKYYGDSSVRQ